METITVISKAANLLGVAPLGTKRSASAVELQASLSHGSCEDHGPTRVSVDAALFRNEYGVRNWIGSAVCPPNREPSRRMSLTCGGSTLFKSSGGPAFQIAESVQPNAGL
jgi:hypothetical protein